jgi:hypothetical protein
MLITNRTIVNWIKYFKKYLTLNYTMQIYSNIQVNDVEAAYMLLIVTAFTKGKGAIHKNKKDRELLE